jgi:TetR/AcrR family transcriptional repressor of nem operon
MARPREFDETQVLTAVMHAFRRSGYSRLSVRQLEATAGMRASSLYNAYGDKAGLYERAVDHYVDSFVRPRLHRHAGPDSTLEDLEGLFLSLLEHPLDDGYGCLVTNAVAEHAAVETDPPPGVAAALDALTEHFTQVLEREVGAEQARVSGPHLLLVYEGMLVLSRAGRLDARHADAVRAEFARLRDLRDTDQR